jgi:hypothetical protein
MTEPKPTFALFERPLDPIPPGTVLERTDLYLSTTGSWEPCPCPGVTLGEGNTTQWVRPRA